MVQYISFEKITEIVVVLFLMLGLFFLVPFPGFAATTLLLGRFGVVSAGVDGSVRFQDEELPAKESALPEVQSFLVVFELGKLHIGKALRLPLVSGEGNVNRCQLLSLEEVANVLSLGLVGQFFEEDYRHELLVSGPATIATLHYHFLAIHNQSLLSHFLESPFLFLRRTELNVGVVLFPVQLQADLHDRLLVLSEQSSEFGLICSFRKGAEEESAAFVVLRRGLADQQLVRTLVVLQFLFGCFLGFELDVAIITLLPFLDHHTHPDYFFGMHQHFQHIRFRPVGGNSLQINCKVSIHVQLLPSSLVYLQFSFIFSRPFPFEGDCLFSRRVVFIFGLSWWFGACFWCWGSYLLLIDVVGVFVGLELFEVVDVSIDFDEAEEGVFAVLVLSMKDVPPHHIFGFFHCSQVHQTASIILVPLHFSSLLNQFFVQLTDCLLVPDHLLLHLDPQPVVLPEQLFRLLGPHPHPGLLHQPNQLISEEPHVVCPLLVVGFGESLVEEVSVDPSGQEVQVFEFYFLAVLTESDGHLIVFDHGFWVVLMELLQFGEVGVDELSVVEDDPPEEPELLGFGRQLLQPTHIAFLVYLAFVLRLQVYQGLLHIQLTTQVVVEVFNFPLPLTLRLPVELAVAFQDFRLRFPKTVLVPHQVEIVVRQSQFSLESQSGLADVVSCLVDLSDHSKERGDFFAVIEEGHYCFEDAQEEGFSKGLVPVHIEEGVGEESGYLQVVAILEGEHEQLGIVPGEDLFVDPLLGLGQPEVFLHDEVGVDFIADDAVDCCRVLVLLVE